MKKHHYAWTICAAGTLLIFITMGAVSNGFSIYLPYIRDEFGLSNAQTSTLVTMRLVVAFFCMLLIGKYYELFEIRLGGSLAAAFGAIAFTIYSFASSFPMFALGAGVSGLAYGFGSMVPVSILMSRWFNDHRALAISICSAGSGLGSVVLPPVITGLLSALSMKTVFRLEAAFIIACALFIYLLIRNNPYDLGLTRLGENRDRLAQTAKDSAAPRSLKAPLTKGVLVLSCTGCFLMGAQGNPGIMHIPVLFTSEGFTAVFAATLMSIIGAALTVGKIIFGEVTDKIGGFRSSVIFFVILALGNGLCCLAGLGSPVISLCAAFTLGFGYSVSTIGPSIWAGDLSSEFEFSKTVRTFQIFYSLGALITASVPGILADHFGGSYVPAFVMFTVMSVVASVLIIGAYIKRK
ncbi:MAG: MFS transporter [Clostridiales bacterium]|nr:MFS transporter [Clostridiales bacterium]